ncbi:MAG: TRAM domain-containing protein, partial [Deltaproteobacteria bacterium]|nr:TRAM domain-containing protein [Deltaproteobacteria bacterium]
KGRVSARVKAQRYHQIMRLQRKISLRRQKEKVGTRIPVLIERPGTSPGILFEGRTQGQAPEVDGITFLGQGGARPGEIVAAVITEATAYDLYGKIIGPA